MTSDEIRGVQVHIRKAIGDGIPDHPEIIPLWEIAYQLAVMNEQRHLNATELERYIRNHEPLGSPVRAESETELRRDYPVAIGWRCLECNYGRRFTDHNLKQAGQKDLEHGICTGCGKRGLALMFDERTTPPNPQTSSIQTKRTEPDPQNLTVAQPDSEGA